MTDILLEKLRLLMRKLQSTDDSVKKIRREIIFKGVDVPVDAKLSDYPEYIKKISDGSGGSSSTVNAPGIAVIDVNEESIDLIDTSGMNIGNKTIRINLTEAGTCMVDEIAIKKGSIDIMETDAAIEVIENLTDGSVDFVKSVTITEDTPEFHDSSTIEFLDETNEETN